MKNEAEKTAIKLQSPGQPVEKTQGKDRNIAAVLFLGVVTITFFTSHGTLSVDPPNRYIVAKSIVDYGDLRMRLEPDETPPPGTRIGRDGNYYSGFGIGQSLIFAGPYYFFHHLLGIDSDKIIRSLISLTVFPLTLGLIAVVFFALLRGFDFSRRHSYLGSVLLIFATGLWQVSKEGQEDTHLALFYIVIAYAIRSYQKSGELKHLILSGFAVSFAFLTRCDTAPTVMCYMLFAFYLIYRNNRAANPVEGVCGSGPADSSGRLRRGLMPYVVVIAFTLPALLIHCYINYSIYGNPWSAPHNSFSLAFLPRGLSGLLLSPGRSLFIYNPIIVFGFIGLISLWRLHRAWAVFAGVTFTCCLILHATVDCFHGNCCWGPRYLYRVIPFLFIPLAFWLFGDPSSPKKFQSLTRRLVTIVVVCLSVLVQVAAVSMHHVRELTQLEAAYNVSWSERQWTMWEPQAHFLMMRLVNIGESIDEMINDKIGPWPTVPDDQLSAQEKLNTPALRYLAFWPFHITYYLPVVNPAITVPLWVSTLLLLFGFAMGLFILYRGYRGCTE